MEDELVQGDALAAGLGDSRAGSLGEAQSSNSELGDFVNSLVISHGGHDHGGAFAAKSDAPLLTSWLRGA